MKTGSCILPVAGIFCLALACSSPKPERPGTAPVPLAEQRRADSIRQEEDTIRAKVAGFYQAFSRRNWQAVGAGFFPGAGISSFRLTESDSYPVVQIKTIEAFLAAAPGIYNQADSFRIGGNSETVISLSTNLADAWIGFESATYKGGEASRWTGTAVFTFMREQKQWKIVSLAFKPNDLQQ